MIADFKASKDGASHCCAYFCAERWFGFGHYRDTLRAQSQLRPGASNSHPSLCILEVRIDMLVIVPGLQIPRSPLLHLEEHIVDENDTVN